MAEKRSTPAHSILTKRYAGRRPYDTANLSYVPLQDLTKMVLRQQRFVVRDAETGADITREILDHLH